MPASWDEYRRSPELTRQYKACACGFRSAFAGQRANIERIVEQVEPASVVCLGAGVLNDIPYEALVRSGAGLALVDWLPGASASGVANRIVTQDERGRPQCLYCDARIPEATLFCRSFERDSSGDDDVYDNFAPVSPDGRTCAAFEIGQCPAIRCENVTGGYADSFARQVPDRINRVRSWREALERALEIAQRTEARATTMSLDDESADLVTSSMVVSQFEVEPYQFFARNAAEILGAPTEAEERELGSLLASLQDSLFTIQLRSHCREIDRLLTPDGLAYLSFELFHSATPPRGWFLVRPMVRAIEIICEVFEPRFDVIPPAGLIDEFANGAARSVVYGLVVQRAGVG